MRMMLGFCCASAVPVTSAALTTTMNSRSQNRRASIRMSGPPVSERVRCIREPMPKSFMLSLVTSLLTLRRDGEALVELPAALLEFLVGQGRQPARDEAHVLRSLDVRALREAGHALGPGDVVHGHGHHQRPGLGAPENGPRRRDLHNGSHRL